MNLCGLFAASKSLWRGESRQLPTLRNRVHRTGHRGCINRNATVSKLAAPTEIQERGPAAPAPLEYVDIEVAWPIGESFFATGDAYCFLQAAEDGAPSPELYTPRPQDNPRAT